MSQELMIRSAPTVPEDGVPSYSISQYAYAVSARFNRNAQQAN